MDAKTTKKIYGKADILLHCINKNFISLEDEGRKECVFHFNQVLEKLIGEMKNQDVLFGAIYERMCGAGSYFDGLRVAQASEFDMDVVLRLPINYSEIIIENADVPPAFVKVKITKALDLLRQHPRWTTHYRVMDFWRDSNGYLLQTKFRTWMEGVVNKALNTFPKVEGNCSEITIPQNGSDATNSRDAVKYKVSLKKSGPAMTLNISMPGELPNVDVDLVPVIEFKYPQWPPKFVRGLDQELVNKKKASWFIVPKPKNSKLFKDFFWRLAFHDQEREMLHGKASLKPVCRLLKKFRDTRSMSQVASYYIKTLFLWEVQDNKDPEFWQQSLTKLFLHMLNKLRQSMKDGHIYYFWDKRYNLLENMTPGQFSNYEGNLNNALKNIGRKLIGDPEKNNSDPSALLEYLLIKSEIEKFEEMRISLGIKERSPVRSLVQSTNGVQNPAEDGRRKTEMQAKPEKSDLQEMKEMMDKMQNMVFETNANVAQILKRVETLEGKIALLEDDVKALKQQNMLPLTKGQVDVKSLCDINTGINSIFKY